jgi:hypothetical protein
MEKHRCEVFKKERTASKLVNSLHQKKLWGGAWWSPSALDSPEGRGFTRKSDKSKWKLKTKRPTGGGPSHALCLKLYRN